MRATDTHGTPWDTDSMWNSGPGGTPGEGQERTLIDRALVKQILEALASDDANLRDVARRDLMNECPQWWSGGPVLPRYRKR